MYRLDDNDNRDKCISVNDTECESYSDLSKATPMVMKETEISSCLTHVVLSCIETMVNEYLYVNYPNLNRKKNTYIKQYIKNNNHNIISESSLYDNVADRYSKNNVSYRNILKYISEEGVEVKNKNGENRYIINDYIRISNSGKHNKGCRKNIIHTMKYILSNNIPIIGGIRVPLNINKSEKNGIIGDNNKFNFNYGVLIVGHYDNFNGTKKGYFKFQNSWGKQWGEKGFGYISYAAFKKQKCLDMWIITDMDVYNDDNIYNIKLNC